MSSTLKRWIAAIAAVLLASLGLTAMAVSAASAADESPSASFDGMVLSCVQTTDPYPGMAISIDGTITINGAPGTDYIWGTAIITGPAPVDLSISSFAVGNGSGTWEQATGTAAEKNASVVPGTYTVVTSVRYGWSGETFATSAPVTVTCDDTTPVEVAPKVTGTLTGGLSDNMSVVNYDLVFDQGTSTEGPWTVSIEGPHGTAKTVSVTGSGPVQGSFPYACGDETFYVSVSGQDGYSSGQDVSIPCPVQEVAPSVSATFQGSLLENVPSVGYTVNYNPGTHTGAQVVTIATLDGKILDLTFEGAGSLTGTFPLACGDHTLLAVLMNGEQRIGSEPQSVTVPCAVDNGNTGGGTDGGTTTPPTGGETGGTTAPVANTNSGGAGGAHNATVPTENVVNAGATGDHFVSPLPLYAGGTLVVVAAIVLVVRRKLVGSTR